MLHDLAISQKSEASLATMLLWGIYKLENLQVVARTHAEAWPWWTDSWAGFAVLAEFLDTAGTGGAGAGDGGCARPLGRARDGTAHA